VYAFSLTRLRAGAPSRREPKICAHFQLIFDWEGLLTKYTAKIVIANVTKAGRSQASLREGGGSRSETEGEREGKKTPLNMGRRNAFCVRILPHPPAGGSSLPEGA